MSLTLQIPVDDSNFQEVLKETSDLVTADATVGDVGYVAQILDHVGGFALENTKAIDEVIDNIYTLPTLA